MLLRQCTKRPPKNGIDTKADDGAGRMAKRQVAIFWSDHFYYQSLLSSMCVCVACAVCVFLPASSYSFVFLLKYAFVASTNILICWNGKAAIAFQLTHGKACIRRSISRTTATTTILRFVYCILLRLLLSVIAARAQRCAG